MTVRKPNPAFLLREAGGLAAGGDGPFAGWWNGSAGMLPLSERCRYVIRKQSTDGYWAKGT
jgi:hypothetical protein